MACLSLVRHTTAETNNNTGRCHLVAGDGPDQRQLDFLGLMSQYRGRAYYSGMLGRGTRSITSLTALLSKIDLGRC